MDETFKDIMGKEIDLLINYPKTKRDPLKRAQEKTEEDKEIARKFGKEFLMVRENMVMEVSLTILDFGNL